VIDRSQPSIAQLFALSLPTWVFAGYTLARHSFLAAYLSYDLGLSIGVVSWLVTLSGLASIPAEIIAGAMCDRGPRWLGPRVTWMLCGTLLLVAGSGGLLLLDRGSGGPVQIALALVALVVGWAFCNVTHGAWALEVTSNGAGRTRVFGLRSLAGIIGGVTFSLIGVVQVGHGWSPFTTIVLAVAIGAPLAHAGLIATLPDRAPATGQWRRSLIVEPLRLLFANRENRRLATLFALNGMHSAIMGTAYLYLVRNALSLPGWGETGLLLQAVCAAIGMAVAITFGARLPATTTLRAISLVKLLLGSALLLMPGDQPSLLMLWTALLGLVSAVDFMALRVLLGERLDASSQTAPARAAAYYAGFHLPYNLCAALATGALLLAYWLFGFDPVKAHGTEQSYFAAQLLPALSTASLMIFSLRLLYLPSAIDRDTPAQRGCPRLIA
jgi:Na+/melibiose symporter-like transporter